MRGRPPTVHVLSTGEYHVDVKGVRYYFRMGRDNRIRPAEGTRGYYGTPEYHYAKERVREYLQRQV